MRLQVVLLHYPKSMWPDKEEARVLKLFKKLGIVAVEMPLPGTKQRGKYSLQVNHYAQLLIRLGAILLVDVSVCTVSQC